MKSAYLAGVASILILPFATTASAQDNPADAPQEQAANLGDIVVTARRSAETLQDVPVAVTALSGDFIERQNISSPADVPQFA